LWGVKEGLKPTANQNAPCCIKMRNNFSKKLLAKSFN